MVSKRAVRGISILINLLLVLALFLPQTTAWAAAGTGEIKGTVIDEKGVVVPEASVTLIDTYGNSMGTTYTGGLGTFDYTSLRAGTYQLKVSIDTSDHQYRSITRTMDLQDGQIIRVDLDFSQSKDNVHGALTATIFPSTGQSWQTRDLNLKYQDTTNTLDNVWDINAGLNGSFTYGALPLGTYVMTFSGTDANQHSYRFTKPITISPAKIQQVEVAFTSHVTNDLGTISGSIQGLTDAQFSTLKNIEIDSVDGAASYSLLLDETGQFQLGDVEPGQYRVSFTGDNVDGNQLVSVTAGHVASVTFDLGSDTAGQTGAVLVKLTDVQGNPLVGANVNISSTTQGDFSEGSLSDATGTARFGLLPPGTYNVSFAEHGDMSSLKGNKLVTLYSGVTTTVPFSFVSTQDPKLGTVSGTITDRQNQPLASGIVTVGKYGLIGMLSETESVPLNADGTYSIPNLQPDHYLLNFDGYTAAGVHVWGSKDVDVLANSNAADNFSFAAQTSDTTGAVTGTVTDGSGNQVAGVHLHLSRVSVGTASDTLSLSQDADDAGAFAFGLLDPGTYSLSLSVQGANGTTTMSKKVVIAKGQVTQTDVSLGTPGSGGAISGTVTDTTGAPIANVLVSVQANDLSFSVSTDASGAYAISGIPTGSFPVTASFQGNSTSQWITNLATFAAGKTVSMDFQFIQGVSAHSGSISGTITDRTGKPIPQALVQVELGNLIIAQQADDNGAYTFTDLTPGLYTVEAFANGQLQVKKNNQDVKADKNTVVNLIVFQAPMVNAVTAGDNKVTGTAEPNMTITVKVGDRVLNNLSKSDSNTKANGQFAVTIPPQVMGTVLTVTAKDAAGHVSDPVTVNVQQAFSKAPDVTKVVVVNASGTQDSVTVSGLTVGDVVTLYDAPDMGNKLASSAPVARGRTQVVINLPLEQKGGTLYATITSVNKRESARVTVDYAAERTVAPQVSQLRVQNHTGNQDTIVVSQLHAGDVVHVYNKSTNGQVLGTAIATESESGTEATVSMALPTVVEGDVYVTVTGTGLSESPMTKLHYAAEPSQTPDLKSIQVTNTLGSSDVVTVGGLLPGDVVKVYSAKDAVRPLATSLLVAVKQTSATVKLALPNAKGGSIFLAVTSKSLSESTRVEASYLPEPSAPLNIKQIRIQNGIDAADVVTVTGLSAGDQIHVYDRITSGNELGSATAQGDDTNGYVATASLALPSSTTGTVYVSVVRAGQPESTRIAAAYTAEPYKALQVDQIQVLNILGRSDSVAVKGLNNGDVVSVYADLNTTRALGTGTAKGSTANVPLTLTTTGGTVYVTVKSSIHPESARTPVTYGLEMTPALTATQITVTNVVGDQDHVVVNGLKVGDVVNVYDSPAKSNKLGTAVAVAGSSRTSTATASVPLTLQATGGTIMVTVTSGSLLESAPTAKNYLSEPPSALSQQQVTLVNKRGGSDVMTVTGLQPGDKIKVYSLQTGGSLMTTSTPVGGDQSAVTFTLRLPLTTAGAVYVTVVNKDNLECSTRTKIAYDAEPPATLELSA